jgi:uncharacterized OB-fold protein
VKQYIDFSKGPLPDVEYPEWAPFWEGTRLGEIRFPKCQDCNRFHWYPTWRCPFCHSRNIDWQALKGQPKLFTWTCMRSGLTEVFALRGEYIVAMVEYDDAPDLYITSNLVECRPEGVKIGMPLEVVFQKVDSKITMPLFKPAKVEHL